MKIYNDDCLKILKEMPDKSIDMILQDPPFNTTVCDWEWDIMEKINEFWMEWKRVIKDNGVIINFGCEPFSSKLRLSNLKHYKYDWIWLKNYMTGHLNSKKQPMRNIENILVFYANQCKYYPQGIEDFNKIKKRGSSPKTNGACGLVNLQTHTGYPTQQLKFDRDQPSVHPTQKPVALMEYLIRTYTDEGNIVFDGFMGSGTTGIACQNTNREFIGVELNEEYFKIAENRIANTRVRLERESKAVNFLEW